MPQTPAAIAAHTDPFPTTLDAVLQQIDTLFGIDAVLADAGTDRTAVYYEQSRIGYDRLHSHKGCMHVALNPDARFDPAGFLSQPHLVLAHVQDLGAARVLELGCGMGFNARVVAEGAPECSVIGLDLMPQHVQAATQAAQVMPNLSFHTGSFDDLPPDLGRFDVIFAVETLCYSADPAALAHALSRHLNPGGRFVMFDGFRTAGFDAAPHPMQQATRLYEIGMAVNAGFATLGDWRSALGDAGLHLRQAKDITLNTLPGVRMLQQRALTHLGDWKKRLLVRGLPRYLARNAISALLGPHVCYGPGPKPDSTQGCMMYARVVAEKPR